MAGVARVSRFLCVGTVLFRIIICQWPGFECTAKADRLYVVDPVWLAHDTSRRRNRNQHPNLLKRVLEHPYVFRFFPFLILLTPGDTQRTYLQHPGYEKWAIGRYRIMYG
jgi:hypothetical protein